jgi:hypothetical protein
MSCNIWNAIDGCCINIQLRKIPASATATTSQLRKEKRKDFRRVQKQLQQEYYHHVVHFFARGVGEGGVKTKLKGVFFYACILRYYLSKPKLFFECGITIPQDAGTPSLALLQKI